MSENAERTKKDFYFKCPACKAGKVKIGRIIYDLPDGDKMLIIKFECDKCNFIKNDTIPLTTRLEPGILTLNVTSEEDLKSKVYRSPVAKLEIPELDVIVEPGPNADFYYTNIEGILYRFENAVSIYKKNLKEDDLEYDEIKEILKNLRKALKGGFHFTLVITDQEGGSYIIPQNKSNYSFKKLQINNE